jgi:hypothetical protein
MNNSLNSNVEKIIPSRQTALRDTLPSCRRPVYPGGG